MRFELPEGLSPDEERAVLAALERHFASRDPDPWAMAGRLEACRDGALQNRGRLRNAWAAAGREAAFAHRGTEPIRGRGDAA